MEAFQYKSILKSCTTHYDRRCRVHSYTRQARRDKMAQKKDLNKQKLNYINSKLCSEQKSQCIPEHDISSDESSYTMESDQPPEYLTVFDDKCETDDGSGVRESPNSQWKRPAEMTNTKCSSERPQISPCCDTPCKPSGHESCLQCTAAPTSCGNQNNNTYICDENSNYKGPLTAVRKVSFGEPTVVEFPYDEELPPSYEPTTYGASTQDYRLGMLSKSLPVHFLSPTKEKLTRKQMVQLGAMMGLGFVFVTAILIWIFSPTIF